MTAPFAFGARGVTTLWAVLASVINTFRRCARAAALVVVRAIVYGVCDGVSMIVSSPFPPALFDPPGQRPRAAVWSP